ncbi:Ubiquitin carboxyl-terminal hydrolase 36 [Chamberlinius hualienensis]
MRTYMSNKRGPPIPYLLYAVLVHQGVSCYSGHYFCFVRNSDNVWYIMDDSNIRQVSMDYVLSQQAYLLFYTQVPNNGNVPQSSVSPSPSIKQPYTPLYSTPSSSASRGSTINGNLMNESLGGSVSRNSGSQTVVTNCVSAGIDGDSKCNLEVNSSSLKTDNDINSDTTLSNRKRRRDDVDSTSGGHSGEKKRRHNSSHSRISDNSYS